MIITISDMWKNQQKMLDNDNQIKLSSLIGFLAISMGPACYCRSGHMPELLPNLPTFCQLACRISAIAGQFACQYGSHEVTGGTSRAMACCFTCDSTRHCMPMRCMHDDPPRVRPRIMQQAIRHKASSHIPVNPLLYQARASRVWYARFVAMACPFACLLFSHVNDSQTH